MIKINSYTDENVFENAKEYININLKQGDYFSAYLLQRLFLIGYNKACRVIEMLVNQKIISKRGNTIKTHIVL